MKITLDIEDTLMREAVLFAAQQGMSLNRLVEDCLQMQLGQDIGTDHSRRNRKLPVSPSTGGLLPGIDPCSNVSMLDAADSA